MIAGPHPGEAGGPGRGGAHAAAHAQQEHVWRHNDRHNPVRASVGRLAQEAVQPAGRRRRQREVAYSPSCIQWYGLSALPYQLCRRESLEARKVGKRGCNLSYLCVAGCLQPPMWLSRALCAPHRKPARSSHANHAHHPLQHPSRRTTSAGRRTSTTRCCASMGTTTTCAVSGGGQGRAGQGRTVCQFCPSVHAAVQLLDTRPATQASACCLAGGARSDEVEAGE